MQWNLDDTAWFDSFDLYFCTPDTIFTLVEGFRIPRSKQTASWDWNPADVKAQLEKNNTVLRAEELYYFNTTMRSDSGSMFPIQSISGKYGVEGYGRISSGHRLHKGHGVVAAIVALGMGVLFL